MQNLFFSVDQTYTCLFSKVRKIILKSKLKKREKLMMRCTNELVFGIWQCNADDLEKKIKIKERKKICYDEIFT